MCAGDECPTLLTTKNQKKYSCVAAGRFRRTLITQNSESISYSHSPFTREADTQSVAPFNVKPHVRGCKETRPFQKALHLRQHKCLNMFKAYHLRDEVEQIELCAVVHSLANFDCSNYLGPLPSKGRHSRRHLGASKTQKYGRGRSMCRGGWVLRGAPRRFFLSIPFARVDQA